MKYQDLKREFNVIIDPIGDDPITDKERYVELKNAHRFLYAHNEYFIGVTVGYQIKDRVVEPMFVAVPVVLIDGARFAVQVPSEEISRVNTILFEQWKKGDSDFHALFAGKENLIDEEKV